MHALPRTPLATVDIIIRLPDEKIVLIERKNPPYGWAIPGGFIDYGESAEEAALREAKEEIGLDVTLERQFHVYSDPRRDKRFHTISTVFLATASGTPQAADDAKNVGIFDREQAFALPLAFDHREILQDFFERKF
ncbi:MAG: NUDIX hydrolase [Myxococcales bacterium]|nr:NUDIX hydrolase [Myxococcales bacterium]